VIKRPEWLKRNERGEETGGKRTVAGKPYSPKHLGKSTRPGVKELVPSNNNHPHKLEKSN